MAPIPSTHHATGLSSGDAVIRMCIDAIFATLVFIGLVTVMTWLTDLKTRDENWTEQGRQGNISAPRIQHRREARAISELVHLIMSQPKQERLAMRIRIFDDLMGLDSGVKKEICASWLEDLVNSDEGIAWGEGLGAGLMSLRDL